MKQHHQIDNKSAKELSRNVIIINEFGLHARSAARIAELVQNAKSKVWIIKDGKRVDASSIIDILTLACGKGSNITLTINSWSDIDILNAIVQLIERGFEE